MSQSKLFSIGKPNASHKILEELTISPTLRSRINTCTQGSCSGSGNVGGRYVLYLPTVSLRKKHNPAFALACHLANHLNLPCLVLYTILDDDSLPLLKKNNNNNINNTSFFSPICMTSRRLAFLTEAISETGPEWSKHGAGVAIRVHGPSCRNPDYLTLTHGAGVVVMDEPFVHPFVSLVRRVELACRKSNTTCVRVDGSTTVPPVSILDQKTSVGGEGGKGGGNVEYKGVPTKAWAWQKKTEKFRRDQITNVVEKGAFDAPELMIRVEEEDFFLNTTKCGDDCEAKNDEMAFDCTNDDKEEDTSRIKAIHYTDFPPLWQNRDTPAPGKRPWTISELNDLVLSGPNAIKEWSLSWPGADPTVPPCTQTVGTSSAGIIRWNSWVRDRKGLTNYARKRTNILEPHGSSRMSCYLNFGIVSIFQLVHEVKLAQAAKVSGADKFEQEIVKWREMSYAHAFGRYDYNDTGSVPNWAVQYIEHAVGGREDDGGDVFNNIQRLERGDTGNLKWDSMQHYLVNTGELHNNTRMTWGKQLVEWGVLAPILTENSEPESPLKTAQIMRTLCYLNDRYALDGLSPPSYAGLLWCIGWSDKPDRTGGISKKPASRYKISLEGLQNAQGNLMDRSATENSKRVQQSSIIGSLIRQEQGIKRGSSSLSCNNRTKKRLASPSSKTLKQYFTSKTK